MNIKELIRAEKTDLDLGRWSFGHVPRHAFPMSRLTDKRYKYGPDYAWRVVKFTACGHSCRIWIQLNESKEILRARCGVDVGGDMVVLCTHEFHASEPGWHCHVTFDPASAVPPSSARLAGQRKWPRVIRPQPFAVDQKSALTLVARVFGFEESEGGLI